MEQITVMPVTAWHIGLAPAMQVGLIRLAFLSQPKQEASQADQSPIYGLSVQQMRTLSEALGKAADQLQAAAPVAGRTPQPE